MRTVVDPRFPALLGNLLMANGQSHRAVADAANISRSYLSELVNGKTMPSRSVAAALDAALGAKGKLTALVAPAGSDSDLDRLAAAVDNLRNVNTATVESLGRVLAAQRTVDDTMGSAALIGPVVSQLEAITQMLMTCTGRTRPALVSVAGQFAQFAGWLHISAAKWDGARDWFRTAMEWAQEVGDPDLIATILSYQGHLAWLRSHPGPALGLSQAALRDERVYPGQRAYDAYAVARAHALLGDLPAADVMLERADELAEATAAWSGETPPWQYYRQPWFWHLERGLTQLHAARWVNARAEVAVTDLRAGLAGMPEEMRRADWAAEYVTHLAAAHIYAGRPNEARTAIEDARSVAEATGSRRVMQLVEGRERNLRVAALTA